MQGLQLLLCFLLTRRFISMLIWSYSKFFFFRQGTLSYFSFFLFFFFSFSFFFSFFFVFSTLFFCFFLPIVYSSPGMTDWGERGGVEKVTMTQTRVSLKRFWVSDWWGTGVIEGTLSSLFLPLPLPLSLSLSPSPSFSLACSFFFFFLSLPAASRVLRYLLVTCYCTVHIAPIPDSARVQCRAELA